MKISGNLTVLAAMLSAVTCMSCSIACAADMQLTVSVGQNTYHYDAATLLSRKDAVTIVVENDISYRRAMTYRAVPVLALLGSVSDGQFDTLETRAADGFTAQIPVSLLAKGAHGGATAWLAVEDPAQPWGPLPKHSESAGPFYLVWENPERSNVRTEQWAFRLTSLSLVESPAHRWPQLGLPAERLSDPAARAGQKVFFNFCLPCHSLNGGGAGTMGPDLGQPMSATDYLSETGLRSIIRNPRDVRTWPNQRMPQFRAEVLPDTDVDELLVYLRLMAAKSKHQKMADSAGVPPAAGRTPTEHAAPAAPGTPLEVVNEIDRLVRKHYYAPGRLASLRWDAAVDHARKAVAATAEGPGRTAVLRELLATLAASHTDYYPREDPAFWQLWGIFEPYLLQSCPKPLRPPMPLRAVDIGVFWKQLGTEWVAGGVYTGGPADKAGMKAGDEVVRADNAPFGPVSAFAGKAGMPVGLDVRRGPEGTALHLSVVPETEKPHVELRKATQDSWRVIERDSRKIAYLHVWAWTSRAIQETVEDAIAKSNQVPVDGFVLDLRDGWGGANPSYLSIFNQDIPVLQSIQRDGSMTAGYNQQIRKPAVILINSGTRSGKEIIAYGAKKHHLARLVGERTAGAVLGGSPYCLPDGALLLLAVQDARVDGEQLEGAGVEPDVEVPFDLRHSGGKDPQLEKALEILTQ